MQYFTILVRLKKYFGPRTTLYTPRDLTGARKLLDIDLENRASILMNMIFCLVLKYMSFGNNDA